MQFWRKGDIIVQMGTDKTLVHLMSTIHDTTVVNTGKKDRRTDLEIQKPHAVFRYHKFMKGIDRADKYLSYYSVLPKTVKWPNVFAKWCTLQFIFVYKTLNTKKK